MRRKSEDIFLDHLEPSVRADIERAKEALDQCEIEEARKVLSPLVEIGLNPAIFYAASFSLSGESIREFEDRRISQLKLAADSDFPPAIHELAVHYDTGEIVQRDANRAAIMFKKAADLGHPHSQWIHGLDLLYGRNGIEMNEIHGMNYISRSAEAKFEGALESMVEYFAEGKHGMPVDIVKSQLFRQVLDDGDFITY